MPPDAYGYPDEWSQLGDSVMDDSDTFEGGTLPLTGPIPGAGEPVPARVAAIVAIALVLIILGRRGFKGVLNN